MERQNQQNHKPITTAAQNTKTKQRQLSIGFILAKEFSLCAFTNFVDVLAIVNSCANNDKDRACTWKVLSNSIGPIVTNSGISIPVDQTLLAPEQFDYIIVVGSLIDVVSKLDIDESNYLHLAAQSGIPLVGIGTGVLNLVEAGLMHGYKSCLSKFHGQKFLQKFDGLCPIFDKTFIADRNRLSSAGASGAVQLATYLVEKHISRSEARKALHMLIGNVPIKPDAIQPSIPLELNTDSPIVKKSLHIMQQNIDCPLSIDDIALKIGHNKRQIERHFQQALTISPQAAFIVMRLSFAKTLIETTNKPLAEIAIECGFCDSSHLSRLFRRRFGTNPFDIRVKSNLAAQP